ncbi:hypothetical protein LTR36_008718 [Oleoguttula mirabilis]|uniref:Uncharacterized protein n=1 Tax=Oleoguttula mirabilis TaxID=1507867 RepID=A0AAV9JTR5_9PEZI|nr:hypothetical protein LTR36_008718 [Oleoguttula mirabilis]
MRSIAALSALFAIATSGLAAPSDDMRRLRTTCEHTADLLNASLNGVMPLNTSGILQKFVWQIETSTANLNSNNTTWAHNATTYNRIYLDAVYFNYTDCLGTLSEACVRRGRCFHQEHNLPVYNALQRTATAVHAYGQKLAAGNYISRNATIRTITAGSDIVNAEGAWSNNRNYPGKLKRET